MKGSYVADVSFQFLGHRNYVHGSSMLQCMLDACMKLEPQIGDSFRIAQFKIIKEFSNHGKVEAAATSDYTANDRLRNAMARLDIESPSGQFTSLLFSREGEPVTKRISDYNATDYVASVSFRREGLSSARLYKIGNPIDLVRGIVEGNRQLLLIDPENSIQIMKKMRWVYIKNLHVLNLSQTIGEWTVVYGSITSFEMPNRLFTQRGFKIVGFDDSGSEIGFYTQLKSGGTDSPIEQVPF